MARCDLPRPGHFASGDAYFGLSFRPITQALVMFVGLVYLLIRPPVTVAGLLYTAGTLFLCAIALNGHILHYDDTPRS
jgi:hypothetical protein